MKREFIGIMGTMACELEDVENVVIIHVEGKADVHTSAELSKIMEAYLGRGKKQILLDMEKLKYLDSATLAALLRIQKKLKASGGQIKLLKLGGYCWKVFQTSGFLDLFQNFQNRDEALKSFQS